MRVKIGGFSRRGTAVRPAREHATNTGHTDMIPSATWGRRLLFQRENWARLLLDTIDVLLTPQTSLEKAVPFIPGGFWYRAQEELGSNMEVWQKGFSDHRICNPEDYRQHVLHVRHNPVRKRGCEAADEFPHSFPPAGFEFHPSSQGLKPDFLNDCDGAPLSRAPFPSRTVARDRTMLSHDKNQIA